MKTIRSLRRAAFTLIEMLVVIAIIGILMAMLIPGLSKARERARRVKCASQLQKLHEACVNYATDAGHYPSAASSESLTHGFRVWRGHTSAWVEWLDYERHPRDEEPPKINEMKTPWWGDDGLRSIRKGEIYSYIKDDRIYCCPTFLWHMKHDKDVKEEHRDAHRSYVMNAAISGIRVANLGSQSGGMSRRMLLADGAYDIQDESGNPTGATWGLNDEADDDDTHTPDSKTVRYFYRDIDGMLEHQHERLGYWHDGKANVVFLDGHVERVHYSHTVEVCTGDWGE